LKKRTKKLLLGCRRVVRDSRAKVFASFFKKKCFPLPCRTPQIVSATLHFPGLRVGKTLACAVVAG